MEKKLISTIPKLWRDIPLIIPFCPGCQHGTAVKALCEVIEEMGIEGNTVLVVGVGCYTMASVLVDVDSVMVAHGRPGDVASAMKRILGKDTMVITWQGDGDALAIGCESTIHAAARSEKITTFMINNGNYGTTGGQLAPTSVMGQVTTTSPYGRDQNQGYPIQASEFIGSLKGVAYSARGAFTTPANYKKTKQYMKNAIEKQRNGAGYSFVEILSTCPANWHISPIDSLKRVEEEMIPEFPLGEYKNVDIIE
ncbi:MAG: thiamine pyrophosphate-dependent enzyme [Spirochaetota bacterium]|nr:thiamine pyrophosphate-dependent enzyme [Spirochaetota bacterium]